MLLFKRCTSCGTVKPRRDYYLNDKIRIRSRCKPCYSAIIVRHHKEDRRKANERNRKWKRRIQDEACYHSDFDSFYQMYFFVRALKALLPAEERDVDLTI